jgi:hypothetical protein
MALPDPPVQRTAATTKRSGSLFSAANPRGWPAIGRYQPGDQCRTSSGRALPADSRGPGPGPGQGPAAGSVPVRAPQVIPGASSHDHDRHQLADSFPAAPGHRLQARPAQEHRPALAVDIGATEFPDLGGSNHGAEGSDSAYRSAARRAGRHCGFVAFRSSARECAVGAISEGTGAPGSGAPAGRVCGACPGAARQRSWP